ncbi:MAG: hypothetical protein OQK32_02695 [Gammaproteobacteria bacterium]|nr:hypothetical protein [Gammaproteobacteria bacterium]MCW8922830.1 hypothetical protein [Gammaproteobacteria bacterium]
MRTPLYARHNEVTPLATREGKIDALYYNHVQTALKILGPHIRLRIPTLKHLDLVLQKDAWIVIDRALHDYPILCWTGFETAHRDNLHEPIKCEIRYFHFAASMIFNKTLEAMELMLGELLEEELSDEKSSVLPFRKD